jgi:Fe-S-cluster containining protein
MVETFYLHLEFKNKNGAWSINLPFLCDKCGVCCTLDDFLTAGEIRKSKERPEVFARMETLKEQLGKLFEEDEEKYDQYITSTPCPFKNGNTCSIYELRPEGCRQFPNTPFGMQTTDCGALDRFIKQRLALKRGRATKETVHSTSEPIKPAKCTEKQYDSCLEKLQKTNPTTEEIAFFKSFNKQKMA